MEVLREETAALDLISGGDSKKKARPHVELRSISNASKIMSVTDIDG